MKLNEKLKQILIEKITEYDFRKIKDMKIDPNQTDLEYRIIEHLTYDLNFINFGSICDHFSNIPEYQIKKILYFYRISHELKYFKINLKSMDWIRNISGLLKEFLAYDGNTGTRPNLRIGKMIYILNNNRTMNRYKLFSIYLFIHVFKESFSETEYAEIKKILKLSTYGFLKFILITMLKTLQKTYPELNSYKQNEQEIEIDNDQAIEASDNEQIIDESSNELKELISNPEKIKKLYSDYERLKIELNNAREINDFYELQLKEKEKEMETKMQEIREEIKIEFFKTLNSIKSGQVLDNYLKVKNTLASIKAQGWKPEKNVAQLEAIIYILDKFLKSQGIEPIYKIDEMIDLPYSHLQTVNYHGEPFIDEQDIKKVIVKSPGWKINGINISKPDVLQYEGGK